MSEQDDRSFDEGDDPLELKLRRALRLITGVVLLLLIVVMALADTFGRPAGFKASEVIVTALIGAVLLILSVEGAAAIARMAKR